jgi:hypothetical protein
MRFTRCFAACAMSLVFSVCIPATSSSDISAEKEQAIRKLMEMIGATDFGTQVNQQLLSQMRFDFPQVPESLWAEFAESLDPAELTSMAIPIYDRHFTMEELQALIDFYTTPVGQKIVNKLPLVAQESNAIGQQWGETKALEIMQRLAERGYYRQQL